MKKKFQAVHVASIAALIGFFHSPVAQGATLAVGTKIGVDFGGGADNNFNNVSGNGTFSTIIETALGDTLTGVGLTTSGIFGSNGQANGGATGQPSQFSFANLDDWVLADNGVSLTITFTGLTDSFTYGLVIGAADGAASYDVDTTFSVDGQTLTNEGDVGATAFVTFANLETDGSGNLVITAVNANSALGSVGRFSGISALELTAVPEPSSLALLGLGGLCVVLRRRR